MRLSTLCGLHRDTEHQAWGPVAVVSYFLISFTELLGTHFTAYPCRLKFLIFRVLLKRLFSSDVEFMIHLLNIERLNVERLWQTAQRGRIKCRKCPTLNTTQRRKTKHRNYLMSKAKNATQHRKTECRIEL